MAPVLVLGLFVGVPIALILLFRSNAAIIFLSLCVGDLLVHYVGTDAITAASNRVSANNLPSIVQIGLLLLPAFLSLLLLRKSVSPSKLPLNVVAAVGVGLVTAILVVPLLPGGVQANVVNNVWWTRAAPYQKWVIAGGSAVALIGVWFARGGSRAHSKKHK